jgi:hypothetical protein
MAGNSSLGFELICCLDKKLLIDIREELSRHHHLSKISIQQFCAVVIKRLRPSKRATISENKTETDCNPPLRKRRQSNFTGDYTPLLHLLCRVFDSVDVDSRGYICWDDFAAYCIREGRNHFRPSFQLSRLDYKQRLDRVARIQARKLLFVPNTQILYAFYGENPYVYVLRFVDHGVMHCKIIERSLLIENVL